MRLYKNSFDVLTLRLARLANFLSDWFIPIIVIAVAYYVYANFISTNWNKELLKAATIGDLKLLQKALKHKANVDEKDSEDRTALILASSNKTESSAAIIAALLSANAKVDHRDLGGKTALLYASFNGITEAVQLLLNRRADINLKCYDGTTALILASC